MSGDPQIDAEIKKLTALSIWKRGKLPQTIPDPFYVSGLKPATQAMITADLEVTQASVDFQAFITEVLDLTSETLHESRHFSTPFPTLADWLGKVNENAISKINIFVQETDTNIERIMEAIQMLTTSISAETKQRILNHPGESLYFRRGGQAWGSIKIYGEDDWNKHQKETEEKLQILKLGISFHKKSNVIFDAAIKAREAKRPEIEKRIKAAAKLCHDAENLIAKIHDADATVTASYFKDMKAIEKFVKYWRRLDAWRGEFYALRGSGIEFQDFGSPEPIFPSSAFLIALESDADKKGKIFQIFEKMEK